MKIKMSELIFKLETDDGWPPVVKECIVYSDCELGCQVEVAPLFIKDLSVGDVIKVDKGVFGDVISWEHVERSNRSTVWIMVYGDYSIEKFLDALKSFGCNVERFEEYQYFAIDVPPECSAERLDECLEGLDEDRSAVAFPSFRH